MNEGNEITESDVEVLLEEAFRQESNQENIIIKEFLTLVGGDIKVEFQIEVDEVIYKNNRITIKNDNTFHLTLSEKFEGESVQDLIEKKLKELIESKSE